MSGYWIVIAIAALAVVAVLIAILTDEEEAAGDGDKNVAAITTFGIQRLADGSDWVASLRAYAGADLTIDDRTGPPAATRDIPDLVEAMRTTDLLGSMIVALSARPPADDEEIGAWEKSLGTTLVDLQRRGIGIVVVMPALLADSTGEPMGGSTPAARWHATVARLTTAAGALLLTTGETIAERDDQGSEAGEVARSALAWLVDDARDGESNAM